jgi:hypothetical protein
VTIGSEVSGIEDGTATSWELVQKLLHLQSTNMPSDTIDKVKTPAVKRKILTIRDNSTANQPTGNSIDPEGVHIGQPSKV